MIADMTTDPQESNSAAPLPVSAALSASVSPQDRDRLLEKFRVDLAVERARHAAAAARQDSGQDSEQDSNPS